MLQHDNFVRIIENRYCFKGLHINILHKDTIFYQSYFLFNSPLLLGLTINYFVILDFIRKRYAKKTQKANQKRERF